MSPSRGAGGTESPLHTFPPLHVPATESLSGMEEQAARKPPVPVGDKKVAPPGRPSLNRVARIPPEFAVDSDLGGQPVLSCRRRRVGTKLSGGPGSFHVRPFAVRGRTGLPSGIDDGVVGALDDGVLQSDAACRGNGAEGHPAGGHREQFQPLVGAVDRLIRAWEKLPIRSRRRRRRRARRPECLRLRCRRRRACRRDWRRGFGLGRIPAPGC